MARPPLPRQSVIQPLNKSYRFIPLTRNKNAIVDVEDFEWLSQWNWHARLTRNSNTFYAARTDWGQKIFMHREVLGCKTEVDHKNGDALDNRKQNLRKSTHAQNMCNVGTPSNNTSGFKGVSWGRRENKWRSYITLHGKQKHLGFFPNKEDAAHAYDEAAKILHGEFARLNYS